MKKLLALSGVFFCLVANMSAQIFDDGEELYINVQRLQPIALESLYQRDMRQDSSSNNYQWAYNTQFYHKEASYPKRIDYLYLKDHPDVYFGVYTKFPLRDGEGPRAIDLLGHGFVRKDVLFNASGEVIFVKIPSFENVKYSGEYIGNNYISQALIKYVEYIVKQSIEENLYGIKGDNPAVLSYLNDRLKKGFKVPSLFASMSMDGDINYRGKDKNIEKGVMFIKQVLADKKKPLILYRVRRIDDMSFAFDFIPWAAKPQHPFFTVKWRVLSKGNFSFENEFTFEELKDDEINIDFSPFFNLPKTASSEDKDKCLLRCLYASRGWARKSGAYADERECFPFSIVERKPVFKGNEDSDFTSWFYDNLKQSDIAKENDIRGRIVLTFIINTDGSLNSIKVKEGGNAFLYKAAVEVINNSPNWTPGMHKGKVVPVKYTLPIVYPNNEASKTGSSKKKKGSFLGKMIGEIIAN